MTEPRPGPVFWRVVTPDGIAILVDEVPPRDPWPKHLAISRELLRQADRAYITAGDGLVRFAPDFGEGALYGFAHTGPSEFVDHYDLIRTIEPRA